MVYRQEVIMALTIKMYMDESCHTQHDKTNTMSLVTVYTINDNQKILEDKIKEVKDKHKIGGELKWNKVSNRNINLYLEVITLLAKAVSENYFKVRTLLIRADKTGIWSNYEDWYYKMAYFLFEIPLMFMIEKATTPINHVELYLDQKDIRSRRQTRKLAHFLQTKIRDEIIVTGRVVDSTTNILIQLADIIAGALTYKERNLRGSNAKMTLIKHIEKAFSINLSRSTSKDRTDFNTFVWTDVYETL